MVIFLRVLAYLLGMGLAVLLAVALNLLITKSFKQKKAVLFGVGVFVSWMSVNIFISPLIVHPYIDRQAKTVAHELVNARSDGIESYVAIYKKYNRNKIDDSFIKENFLYAKESGVNNIDPSTELVFSYMQRINMGRGNHDHLINHFYVYKHQERYLVIRVETRGFKTRYTNASINEAGPFDKIKNINLGGRKEPKLLGDLLSKTK